MLKYNLHLISGLFFELLETWEDKEYKVRFVEIKGEIEDILYEVNLKKGMWGKIPRRYFGDYQIEVWDGSILMERISFAEHIKGKRVFICFDSKSLGDTIAWMPYCLEFKNKFDCDVIVSTFLNGLFEPVYPELTFVGRGVVVENILAMLEIGWFYDANREPRHPATIPLQKAATNILGLPFSEIAPRLHYTPNQRPIKGKYVCISTHSTARLKYWNYWQEVIDYLNERGFEVVEISKEETDLQNLTTMPNKSFPVVMNYLNHADFYIGLSSGLSWLAWAMGKDVFMISNFSRKEHEFQSNCKRIVNEKVCHGCWNEPKFKFDKGNWWYCPEHEDTPRAFECHFKIPASKVIETIKSKYENRSLSYRK